MAGFLGLEKAGGGFVVNYFEVFQHLLLETLHVLVL